LKETDLLGEETEKKNEKEEEFLEG